MLSERNVCLGFVFIMYSHIFLSFPFFFAHLLFRVRWKFWKVLFSSKLIIGVADTYVLSWISDRFL